MLLSTSVLPLRIRPTARPWDKGERRAGCDGWARRARSYTKSRAIPSEKMVTARA
jgi:hypothetical protein